MHPSAPKFRAARRLSLMISLLLSVLMLASQASALSFNFTILDDPADWPWLGRGHTPGVVTGVIHGLQDNLANQIPTSIEFTSDVSALGMTGQVTSAVLTVGAGLTVSGGIITAADLLWNFTDPSAQGTQLRFNYADGTAPGRNVLHWNGGAGPQLGMGNENGFSGAIFSLVPEPHFIGILAFGLVSCLGRIRRQGLAAL